MRRPVGASLVRGTAATLAALLLSGVALAAPRTAPRPPCCAAAAMEGDAPSCCAMAEDAFPASSDPSAGCCRMSAPDEAAPSLTSAAAPALSAPGARVIGLAQPALPRALERNATRVSPRARSAPLHLLYSALLV